MRSTTSSPKQSQLAISLCTLINEKLIQLMALSYTSPDFVIRFPKNIHASEQEVEMKFEIT